MNTDFRSYKVHHLLGEGGFGAVYRADLVGPGGFAKPVALKLLNAEMGQIDEVAQRMRDEARLLGLIRHRAIVQVDGLVMLDGRWAIVMEYIQGVDLSQLLQHGPVPVGPALEIIEETAGALYVAYEKPGPSGVALKVLHRDIKPHNIQLTAQGEVKVLDFGIARAEFDQREAKTRSMLFGSATYMAPERLDFIERHEGDVYSLGVVLFEILTAEALGKAQASPRRHAEQLSEATDKLASRGVAQEVVDLFAHMTAYEPEDRPTANEVAKRVRVLKRKVDGQPLAEWSEDVVPNIRATMDTAQKTDELSGRILRETASGAIVANTAPIDDPPETPFDQVQPAPAAAPPATPAPLSAAEARANLPADHGITLMAPTPMASAPQPSQTPPAPVSAPSVPGTEPAAPLAEVAPSPQSGGSSQGTRVALAGGAAVVGLGGLALVAVLAIVGFFALTGEGPIPDDDPGTDLVEVDADLVDDPTIEAIGTESDEEGEPRTVGEDADAVDDPSTDPTPPGVIAAAVVADDGSADLDEATEAEDTTTACGGLAKLEPVAAMAALTSEQTACLQTWADDASHKLVDRRKVGLALVINYHEACKKGGDCALYESTQRWYFAELDASDPDLMLAYVTHLWKQGDRGADQDAEVYRWAEKALERKSGWKSTEYVRNVDYLYEIRARAAYRMWERKATARDPGEKKAAGLARIASLDWLDNRIGLGKDTTVPLQLCESVTGSAGACDRGQDDAAAVTIVTFVSQPLGAVLFVDDEEIGTAPKTQELSHGGHDIRMVLPDGTEGARAIVVGPREPVRWIWKSGEGAWVSGY